VTLLEPRTLHQPGKLQKLPKNDYLFTPSILVVNKNAVIASTWNSIKCSAFTTMCTKDGAIFPEREQGQAAQRIGFLGKMPPANLRNAVASRTLSCANLSKTALDKEFPFVNCRGQLGNI
jgi:hypothetical protein